MESSASLRRQFEDYLGSLHYSHEPDGLYAPVRYVLSLGGKRMRPVLTLLTCNMYTDDLAQAFGIAAGIEIFHNFTLLHDDVMDKAEMRRGKPTVHIKWNENTAILSGDVMVILAYRILRENAGSHLENILRIADDTFIGIVDGQQYDMDFETRTDVKEEEYMNMIRLKTSVLLGCATAMGAEIGCAPKADADALYRFGVLAGLAFQLQDDLLDVYGDPAVFGKKIGGDILENKKTYLYIKARELAGAAENAELDRWAAYDGPDSASKIAAVTAVYDRLGVRACCQSRIDALFEESLKCLDSISVPAERRTALADYVKELMNRKL